MKNILGLAKDRDEIEVVSDQYGGPTPAKDLARACNFIANNFMHLNLVSGIYHFSGKPDISWFGFANEILKDTNLNVDLKAVSTSHFKSVAERPKNSMLDCTLTEQAFGLERPDWRIALRQNLRELGVLQ